MSIPGIPRSNPDALAASTAADALAVCAQVERGQGRGTLAARFEQLKTASPEPVAVAIALSEGALHGLATWVLQLDGRDALYLPACTRLVVESSRDGHYALTTASGGRRPLRDGRALGSELQAFAQQPGPAGTAIRIEVPPGAERRGRIEMLTTPLSAAEFRSEALAAALADGASIALVAGAQDHVLSAQERDALLDLARMMAAVQPLATPAEGSHNAVQGWWEDAAIMQAPLPLQALTLAHDAWLPLFSGSPVHPAAKPAAAYAQLRALHASLEALGATLARETGRQRALKGREDRILRALESRSGYGSERDVSERLRLRLDESIGRMERQIEDQNRRALLPNGNLNLAVAELLKSLSTPDLEQTEAHNEIRVTIQGAFAARLLDAAKTEIRNQFKDDVNQIKTGADTCKETLAGDLAKATGTRQTLAVAPVDENAIWRSLREALSLQLAYHGTLPKRGFWQRLGEGKQLMFTTLSLLGLGGMVFGFSRSEIGPLLAAGLPVVFFVGVGLTFWNWKQDDAARLGKELERIREQVSMEVKRLIGEIQREKMSRLKDVLEGMRKEFGRRIEGALKEHQAANTEQGTRLRNEARDRQRALDQRLRELQPHGVQVSRLRQGCSEALRDAQEALRALAKSGTGT